MLADRAAASTAQPSEGDERRLAALDASWARRRHRVSAGIEAAALPLFVAHGIDAVTVDEIASAAGISRRTFYRYFSSPEHIVYAALCRIMDGWAKALRERPASEPLITSVFRANERFVTAIEGIDAGMAVKLLARPTKGWFNIAGRVRAHVADDMRGIVAMKLEHRGQDPVQAVPVAAALSAIIMHIVETSMREGRTMMVGEFEAALAALAALLDDRI